MQTENYLVLDGCVLELRKQFMKLEADILPKFQRARGRLELGFTSKKNLNCLSHLHQSGCLKALIPKNYSSVPDVVLINTSGGITGGDELGINVGLSPRAQVRLTTQTAERVYKSNHGFGKIELKFDLKEESALDWLPQETILFDKSAIKREITVRMLETSSLFMIESIILGRDAMGERLTNNLFVDQWRILREKRITYAESLKLSNANELSGFATLGQNKALATLLYVAPNAEQKLERMRTLLKQHNLMSAASAWDGKLVARLVTDCPQRLRETLISIIFKFRQKQVPRVWLI
ncbi:MAG: urease accessory protein [Rhodobacteraceae bacterium]|nr:MAG: urease accessory protein [Paracoccaceae bacterium]